MALHCTALYSTVALHCTVQYCGLHCNVQCTVCSVGQWWVIIRHFPVGLGRSVGGAGCSTALHCTALHCQVIDRSGLCQLRWEQLGEKWPWGTAGGLEEDWRRLPETGWDWLRLPETAWGSAGFCGLAVSNWCGLPIFNFCRLAITDLNELAISNLCELDIGYLCGLAINNLYELVISHLCGLSMGWCIGTKLWLRHRNYGEKWFHIGDNQWNSDLNFVYFQSIGPLGQCFL